VLVARASLVVVPVLVLAPVLVLGVALGSAAASLGSLRRLAAGLRA
jgi:hypothetical protein